MATRLTDVIPLDGFSGREALRLAASAERFSEHPLAEAVRSAAAEQAIALAGAEEFRALPGVGVHGRIDGASVSVGSRRMISRADGLPAIGSLEEQGKTVLYGEREGVLIGLLAAADTVRPEVPAALQRVRKWA